MKCRAETLILFLERRLVEQWGGKVDEHEEETLATLKLSFCEGVSNGIIHALLDHFGSAREALSAPAQELRRVQGIGLGTADSILRGPNEMQLDKELDLMERHRVRLAPLHGDDYPPPLRYLDSGAPVLLRIKGDYRRKDQLAVALVGARRCSTYGRGQARRLSSDLASAGFTIVSGMAQGIDSETHRGALAARGRTLAVLGCGLAYELRPKARELAVEIARQGAVMSELPMETPPRPSNFPPRNRLISGLSLGVVVVEAATRSGSLITARLAGEQGKAVFAVPGAVDNPTSRGCHELIRDGAILVENARDIIEDLGPLSEPITLPEDAGTNTIAETVDDARVMALNERERRILELIGHSHTHIDELVAATDLPPSIVSSTLLTLEIRGMIRQTPGQRYVRG